MRLLPALTAAILLSLLFSSALNAGPQNSPPEQAGTLDMKIEDDVKDPYKMAQSNALSDFAALEAKIAELKNGNVSPVDRPKEPALNYLTGVYLYCTITKGTCPEILDALLETDLINSRIAKKAECPSLLAFWKKWQANDMEARQKFMVRIGNLGATGDFNRNVRPRYIKCRDTITQQIAGTESDAEYFKNRYGTDSSPEADIKKASDYTKTVSERIPNIFSELERMKK